MNGLTLNIMMFLDEVLCLLETLLRKDESLIKESHLPVYFSAYNATLSSHDQILLQVFIYKFFQFVIDHFVIFFNHDELYLIKLLALIH